MPPSSPQCCDVCGHGPYKQTTSLQRHRRVKHGVGQIDPAMRGLTPIHPVQRAQARNKNKKSHNKTRQYIKIGSGRAMLNGEPGDSEIIDLCTPSASPSPSPEVILPPPPASHNHTHRLPSSNNLNRPQWKVNNSSSRNSSPSDSDRPTPSYLRRTSSSSRQRLRLSSDTPMPSGPNNPTPKPNIEQLSLDPESDHPSQTEYDELDSTPAFRASRTPHRRDSVVVLIPSRGRSRSRRDSSVATHFIDSDTPEPERSRSVDSEEITEEVESEEVQEEIEDVPMAQARTPSLSEDEKERERRLRDKRPALTSTPNPTDHERHKDKRQRPPPPANAAQSSSIADEIVSPWANLGHFTRPSWGGGNGAASSSSSSHDQGGLSASSIFRTSHFGQSWFLPPSPFQSHPTTPATTTARSPPPQCESSESEREGSVASVPSIVAEVEVATARNNAQAKQRAPGAGSAIGSPQQVQQAPEPVTQDQTAPAQLPRLVTPDRSLPVYTTPAQPTVLHITTVRTITTPDPAPRVSRIYTPAAPSLPLPRLPPTPAAHITPDAPARPASRPGHGQERLTSVSASIPAVDGTPPPAASPVPPTNLAATTRTTQQLPFPVPASCPAGFSRAASQHMPKTESMPQQEEEEEKENKNKCEYEEVESKLEHENGNQAESKTESKTESNTTAATTTTSHAASCSVTACAACHEFAHAMHWLHTLLGKRTACDGQQPEKGKK